MSATATAAATTGATRASQHDGARRQLARADQEDERAASCDRRARPALAGGQRPGAPVVEQDWSDSMEQRMIVDHAETLQHRPLGPESVIDAASFLNGCLHIGNHLRIEGEARGEIECEGTLTIVDGAQVAAQIRAVNVVIGGTVTGEVTCCHRLEVLPTGRVAGTISTGTIVIQAGGIVEGRLQMRGSGDDQGSDGRAGPGATGVGADRVA